jgi:hypothetical protein
MKLLPLLLIISLNVKSQDTTISKARYDSLMTYYYYTCNILQHVSIARNGVVYFDKMKDFKRSYRAYFEWLNGKKKRAKQPKF